MTEPRNFASPACAMHEADPSYLGYLSVAETVALLAALLEAEQAARETRFCAMLCRHIQRLSGGPAPEQRPEPPTRLEGGATLGLRDALPRIADDGLHADLKAMLEAREREIAHSPSPPETRNDT